MHALAVPRAPKQPQAIEALPEAPPRADGDDAPERVVDRRIPSEGAGDRQPIVRRPRESDRATSTRHRQPVLGGERMSLAPATPASPSFSAATIWASVKRDFFVDMPPETTPPRVSTQLSIL